MYKKFCGVFTALVTPFNEDKSINFDSFETIVNKQIEAGVSGLVVCGTTGESPCLSLAENLELVERCVKITQGRVPVIAGTGSNNTATSCVLSRKAQDLGVDAVLIIGPYYNRPSSEGIFQHFQAINESIDIPIIVYNHPGRTGIDIDIKILTRLSKLNNVIGIKDVSGDLSRVIQIKEIIGDNFAQLSGDDLNILQFYAQGGHGVISVASNVLPGKMMKIHNKIMKNNFADALGEYKKYHNLLELLGCETNPVPVKYVAQLMGICSGEVRLPLVQLQNSNKDRIKEDLSGLGLLK